MQENDVLSRFEKIFVADGKKCNLVEANEEFPLSQLFVDLGQDKQNRPRTLAITLQEQYFQTLLEHQQMQTDSKYYSIQFDAFFPFEMNVHTSREVASVLLFINRLVDLPGFGMSETENQIYFRYVMLTRENCIDKPLLIGVTGTIMLMMDLFGDIIYEAAVGKMTFNQLLEKIIDSANPKS